MKIKLVVIALFLIISGCSYKWCLKKYPPEEYSDTTHSVFKEQVPVVMPGGHFVFETLIDCDTITDTMTIYQTIQLPPDTFWVTETDTVTIIREGKVVTVKEKNPVNKILLGILIGVGVILLVMIFLVIRTYRRAVLRP